MESAVCYAWLPVCHSGVSHKGYSEPISRACLFFLRDYWDIETKFLLFYYHCLDSVLKLTVSKIPKALVEVNIQLYPVKSKKKKKVLFAPPHLTPLPGGNCCLDMYSNRALLLPTDVMYSQAHIHTLFFNVNKITLYSSATWIFRFITVKGIWTYRHLCGRYGPRAQQARNPTPLLTGCVTTGKFLNISFLIYTNIPVIVIKGLLWRLNELMS